MKYTEEESVLEYNKSKENGETTDKFIEIIDSLIDLELDFYTFIQSEVKILLKNELRNICKRGYKNYNPEKGKFSPYFRILIRCGIAQETTRKYEKR